MRLKKGSKVEVLSKEEVATGSWRPAEIISGDGRTYSVKYGWFPVTTMAVLEKVPRKAIRPCPPPVEGLDNWVPGDLVEFFHKLSWKTAMVTESMGGNYFLVRLLGLTKEFEVQKSHLRVRQSWENGTWFIIGKGSQNSLTISTRKRKGSPFRSSYVDSRNLAAQKVRVIEKDGSRQQVFLENAVQASEKVEAFVSPQELLGEKCMNSVFNNGRNDLYRREVGSSDDSFISRISIPVDTESCASSVGSCSANSNVDHTLSFCFSKHHRKDSESLCSDAESFCGRGYEEERCLLPIKENLVSEVSSDAESFLAREDEEEDYPLPINDKLVPGSHRSELLAYRCAIGSLYASGPLTWEEELRMSNLRHSLCISDDEHLMEIRNLIATH